jgi:hypothetical protein
MKPMTTLAAVIDNPRQASGALPRLGLNLAGSFHFGGRHHLIMVGGFAKNHQ